VLIRQQRWRVERVRRWRNVVRLDVVNRQRALTVLAPFDRPDLLTARTPPRPVRRQQLTARLARLVARSIGCREIASALDASVELHGYQLEPALALASGVRRLLVADEVGLGKTIQAGLAMAELLRREPGARILTLVPASIVDQWHDELTRRFGLEPEVASQARLTALARDGAFGDSPWRRAGIWIASLDFLKQPHVLASQPPVPWDLLVVDEAHEAAGDSERAAACHDLGGRSHRVLLLTATPHSGDTDRFDRLLRIGGLPIDDGPPVILRRTRRSLGITSRRQIRWCRVRPSTAEIALLDTLLAFEQHARKGAMRDPHATLLLLAVFRKRALSTPRALRRTIDRRLAWVGRAQQGDTQPRWLQTDLDFVSDDDAMTSAEAGALSTDLGLEAADEQAWLRRLRRLAIAAERRDARVTRLVRLLARTREPVVVFTEFRDSLDVVGRALQGVRTTAELHGGQTRLERRQSLDRFLRGDAGILLATDVAGLGLNLQTRARWVINLELPWNPVRLEQRAGRVDRIGQRRAVRVSLLVTRHPAENHLVAQLAARVLAARGSLGDDLLQASLPDESHVRRVLLDAGPCPAEAAPIPVSVSIRWRRPALAAVRRLAWRRALDARWRGGETPAGPVRSAWRPPALRRVAGSTSTLFVFAVPIVDGLGGLLEHRLVVVSTPHSGPDALSDAREMARRRLRGRARRLARWLVEDARRSAPRDGAVTRYLQAHHRPGLVQAGLFDRRALRSAEGMAAAAGGAARAHRDRLDEGERRAIVTVGQPVLEAVIDPS
jgi:superfamily II DNA or RNA helicase